MNRVTITLPKNVVSFADEIARKTGTTRSKVISDILRERQREELRLALVQGYQALAQESLGFARETAPLDQEDWPAYDDP